MTYTVNPIQQQLSDTEPFNCLPTEVLQSLADTSQLLRYRMGQPILRRETMPHQVILIKEGQVRLLGYDPYTKNPITLDLLGPGDILGLAGPARGVACESAIASTEIVAVAIPITTIKQLIPNHPQFANAVQNQGYLAELFEILSQYFEKQAHNIGDIAEITTTIRNEGIAIQEVPAGPLKHSDLDQRHLWFISRGNIAFHEQGSQLSPTAASTEVLSANGARLVGIPHVTLAAQVETKAAEALDADLWEDTSTASAPEIPYADAIPQGFDRDSEQQSSNVDYPHIRARGEMDTLVACFEMLAKHFNMPFKRDVVRRVLTNQKARLGQVSLASCGAVADMLGLKPQLAKVPASAIGRLPKLALIRWRDSYALLYETSARQYIIGCPEDREIVRHSPQAFEEIWGSDGEVLLLETTAQTPQQRFGLSWFVPSLQKYKWVLVEVLAASFFYQIFGLANPLMIQVIIDRVIVQQSVDTLHVLGIFLVIVAVFEAILGSLRTYLFVDTTNRIDMTLASQTIDHLLRLPLKYFDRRPVGELSSRVNELENIRQFLTGTALTVVLDAVFSVVYIIVMLIYSVKLTVVSLATIPLFLGLTFFVSPIVRRQLRAKAEQNAKTQSFLVEALSGIQTVKAQNIELNTRWKWQDRYSRYVSDGFKTVLTSTTASSASNFLNKISGLLVLWFGAFLVLEGELTLGELIAFRIIAGYVTQPLLRLTQLWQNFQETALSLERLSDIIDHPQEQEEEQRSQIPMPDIKGHVRYENVSFRFGASGPLQLSNINVEFPVGQFVGLVGQSGSGKSTMMKLLPRLYEPNSGRILIDNYDINKVELYSLRRQVGIVPQDSLLFEGTIQENIALTNPEATTDEVIQAAQIACCHEFIMGLPVGYNTRVGERGSSLSGGQRQRIAIARTILQNPRLLILDEATSALDYDTEAQVSNNLMKWAKGRTVFFITHRLGALRTADHILVMDQGSIVEAGTHDQLLALRGRYYCLNQQQGNG
ncbi:cyclic nucleotide-regulated abc bacteriocin lantibiotic exporter [Leptolyngbya sp. Heron Island J]|uniref:peptidase domain-containing ABC transporter n=1 Tax=Leptolyngbya sp. Heron Island J TaxID=1385935 RepID=UPI0003B981E6|nr:peptidase domain-containing ABC transporter [Leptolyngbya sp. Heron Island J]ESA32225.1 cyclic nucleotide-regulated abc bacteriocin lantibiotic exporter [Leptolyngbya sp. Heron Island J]